MRIKSELTEKDQEECLNPILENIMLEIQTRLSRICEEEIINCKLVVHHYLLVFTDKFLFIGNDSA